MTQETSALQFLTQSLGQTESPHFVAKILMEELLGSNPQYNPLVLGISDLKNHSNYPRIWDAVCRINQGEPLQYVLGYAYFYKHRFGVNPSCLIPRPETEELVVLALEQGIDEGVAIDFCTGSGCIAISIALEKPRLKVWATDIDPNTLNTAKQNAGELGAGQVRFLLHDLLRHPLNLESNSVRLIVSNPPYIALDEAQNMSDRVLKHEPHKALFAGEDPLVFYQKLLEHARQLLRQDGIMLCEINPNYASNLSLMASQCGMKSQILKDLSGKSRFWKVHHS